MGAHAKKKDPDGIADEAENHDWLASYTVGDLPAEHCGKCMRALTVHSTSVIHE